MIEYIAIYIFSTVFSFCYAKAKKCSSIAIFATIVFCILFLPLACRYNIGTDYHNYEIAINEYRYGGKFSFPFEYGWFPIVYVIKHWNVSVQYFFIIPAFFSMLILFYVVPRKYFWLCIPAYISVAYLESFSLVRQAFAATIFLLSAKDFIEKKS